MSTFIVELSSSDVRCVAQLLHLGVLQEDPDAAINALESLRQQTDIIKQSPELHDVYPSDLTAPTHAVRFDGRFYVPV